MGVSIWGAVHLHSMDGWALSGEGVQAPWHGALETVWLHCDEAQQVGNLRGLEGCPMVQDAGIQSQFARRRCWRGRWSGYKHCGTKQERSTLQLNAPGLGWLFATLLLQHPNRNQQTASGVWRKLLAKWLKVSTIRERPVQRYSDIFRLGPEGQRFVVEVDFQLTFNFLVVEMEDCRHRFCSAEL